uniref:Uncharacterized protein n=1 Tax=Rangifer tarandus platyrhynchus TaxID=3082113 RepID=A0ACB0EHV2_RANTA|nr:unnamed protein product [Rangifer tarandus platyrhynchus]
MQRRRGGSAARTAAAAGAQSRRGRRERGGGSGCEGGARAAGNQGQRGRSPSRHLLAGPTANQRRREPGRVRGTRREGARARACAGARVPSGRLRPPSPHAGGTRRRGGAGRSRGRGSGCAPGSEPRAPRSPAQCGVGASATEFSDRPQVIPNREIRVFLPLHPRATRPSLTSE